MLLTFDKFAVIPDKMHVFYENAFDTLFSQHDATKEHYTRRHRSGLAIDVFKKVLAVLCAATYAKEQFQIRESELLEVARSSLKYYGATATAEDYIADLIEAVCIVQRDGTELSFTHRSFQEFFCALFLARNGKHTRDRFFEEKSFRIHDSVLPMLFDMAQEQVEVEWVLPLIDKLLILIGKSKDSALTFLVETDRGLVYSLVGDELWDFYILGGELSYEVACLHKMYRAHFVGFGQKESLERSDELELVKLLSQWEKDAVATGDPRFLHSSADENLATFKAARNKRLTIPVNEVVFASSDRPFLEKAGYIQNAEASLKALKNIQKEIRQRKAVRKDFFEDFFQPQGS